MFALSRFCEKIQIDYLHCKYVFTVNTVLLTRFIRAQRMNGYETGYFLLKYPVSGTNVASLCSVRPK